DETVSAELAPFAHNLYRPFPDVSLGVRSLLAFAARGCRGDLAMVVLMGITVTVLGMVPSFATGVLFNNVIPGAHRSQLWQVMMLLITCAVANAGFSVTRGFALQRIQQR